MKFTLNGKPIEIPHSWEQLTYGQFLRVGKVKDDLPELISILTGIDRDTILKAQIKGLEQIIATAKFLDTPPTWGMEGDKVGPYKLPVTSSGKFDIQFETLAQFEDMRSQWASMKTITIDDLTEMFGTFVAIYLQKIRDGEYNYDKALVMAKEEIPNYPAQEVVTVGTFFLIKLKTLLSGTPPSSHPTNQSQGKNIGKGTKKRSGSTVSSTKSRKRSISKRTN